MPATASTVQDYHDIVRFFDIEKLLEYVDISDMMDDDDLHFLMTTHPGMLVMKRAEIRDTWRLRAAKHLRTMGYDIAEVR